MPNKTINHVNMQKLSTFVILLAMSPVLLVLVVVATTAKINLYRPESWIRLFKAVRRVSPS